MGQVIDLFTREVTEEVPREEPLSVLVDMCRLFSEAAFSTLKWPKTTLRVSAQEAGQICSLLKAYGFHETLDLFDPGDYDVRDKKAVIALQAYPESDA